jgi:membrane-bound lytic murein transglycosylase D
MNKLLLLATTTLVCLTLEGYAREIPQQIIPTETKAALSDSTDKKADPKDGFKDLFSDNTSSSSIHTLNPKAISFVQDYMESEGDRLEKMKGWGKPFFDKISDVFTAHSLPVELKYLAVIESDLKSSATSRVGAAGPWQFMAQTARDLGLKVNRSVDERRDFIKSTHAAARYLNDLYDIYGDWLLVIAAYNGGPGNVNAAIRKSGSRNFWDLQNYLPAESRKHVKKFIATHFIMEGSGGVTTSTKKENEALIFASATESGATDPNTTVLNISGKYNSTAIAENVGMDIRDFNRLNPNFDRQLSANGAYDLRLPNEKMSSFQANKSQILEQSVRIMVNSAVR